MSNRKIEFIVIYLVFNLLYLVVLLMALKYGRLWRWSVMGMADLPVFSGDPWPVLTWLSYESPRDPRFPCHPISLMTGGFSRRVASSSI